MRLHVILSKAVGAALSFLLASTFVLFAPLGSLSHEAFVADAAGQTPVAIHGKLSVRGTQLVDEAGNPVQLRGMSTHGMAWFPDYVNEGAFRTLRDDWHANCVRLALYTAEYNGYCTGGDQAYLKGLVDKGVSAATNLGMYVIIDWHVLNDQSPTVYQGQAIEFFREMSQKYADHNNVIYEICNEPNGEDTTWQQVKSYAEAVIPVIRENDPDAVVIVGTPTWSQDVDQAATDPLNFPNLMYALHFYAGTHTQWLRDRAQQAIDRGLPIFVSEFGICDASGNGGININEANEWMKFIDKNNLSYMNWSLCNKAESASAIASWCTKTSNWEEWELAESGKWMRNQLRSEPPEIPAIAPYDDVAGHWADQKGYLKEVTDRGLMKGYTGTKHFGPNDGIQRGQVAVILQRHDDAMTAKAGNTPATYPESNTTPFSDNLDKKYYTSAMNWAYDKQIISGHRDTNLIDPYGLVTRQDLATMLYRYACDHHGLDATVNLSSLNSHPDSGAISNYARPAMAWCVSHDVMSGSASDGALNPQKPATRAEMAKMVLKVADLVEAA